MCISVYGLCMLTAFMFFGCVKDLYYVGKRGGTATLLIKGGASQVLACVNVTVNYRFMNCKHYFA